MPKRGVIVLIGAVIFFFAFVALFVPHPVWSYRGEGRMRDHGILSYPRFRLTLPGIAVGKEEFNSLDDSAG